MICIPLNLLSEAIKTFGVDHQLTIAIEEMSELTKEICKAKRRVKIPLDEFERICEEMADVIIMIEQLKLIFKNRSRVEEYVNRKLDRLGDTILTQQGRL